MRSIELFTGCGGLAMGLSRAGFRGVHMAEWDRHSVHNIQHNRARLVQHVQSWPIHQQDVRLVDWTPYAGLHLVAGGPPCQPFSIGGRHKGHEDDRDMWPEAVRAVRETMPCGFLFENVRGLTRTAFADYLRWVCLALAAPNIQRWSTENRQDHLRVLELHESDADYWVSVTRVNAADFGAAQRRHRVIIAGVRKDISNSPVAFAPTHSRERLLWDQWITGAYWKRHGMKKPEAPERADVSVVEKLKKDGIRPEQLPWQTIRDAIAGLGDPIPEGATVPNHIFQPGARSYKGHTGSHPDMPSKALKAGVHGVPGGENTLVLPDGSVRYFTV